MKKFLHYKLPFAGKIVFDCKNRDDIPYKYRDDHCTLQVSKIVYNHDIECDLKLGL